MELKDVKKLAELSRIDIPESEMEELLNDMKSILGYVDQIESVSADISPDGEFLLKNVTREDGQPHESGIYTEKILEEAPDRDGNYVKVKQIL